MNQAAQQIAHANAQPVDTRNAPADLASAILAAHARSNEFACTVYVNAFVTLDADYAPTITRYAADDWYVSGSTVYVAEYSFARRTAQGTRIS